MNNKHFIGENAKSFESLGLTDQIDGVLLKVDSGTAYRSGDQTGYVLEAECPYGTQAMADGLLAAVQGKSYAGFEAEGARLPVGAELGDGVTVRGLYGPLVRRRIRFGAELSADIGAPAGGDTDHEFGYTDPVERKIELAEARSRSYIDRRADEIRVGVVDEVDGKLAEIGVSLEGITETVKGQGESLAALKLTADALSVDINGAEGSMGLKAAVEGLDFAVNDPDGAVNGKLAAKIGKDENEQIVSMLNASFDQINIKGNRFTLDSDNFKVAADGTITATNGNFTGNITGGTIRIGDNVSVAADGTIEAKNANIENINGLISSEGDFWWGNGAYRGKTVLYNGYMEATSGSAVLVITPYGIELKSRVIHGEFYEDKEVVAIGYDPGSKLGYIRLNGVNL